MARAVLDYAIRRTAAVSAGGVSMEADDQATEPERVEAHDTPVAPYEFLNITRAYNRKEITLEGWMRLTREWVERMITRYGEGQRSSP